MNQEINQTTPPQQPSTGPRTNELVGRVLGFFRAPFFEDDPEKTRIASMLNSILMILGGSYLLLGIVTPFLDWNRFQAFIAVIGLELFVVGNLIALRRGFVRQAALILVIALWIFLIILGGLFGTAYNNFIFPQYVVIIFLSGFLISNRAAIVSGILATANMFVLNFFNQAVELPIIFEPTETLFFSLLVLLFVMITFFVVIANQTTARAFSSVTESDKELRESNKELEDIRTYLEQEVAENTLQLERRSRYLESGAKVANASISTQNLQEMLDIVVNEISAQFGFYHVGIFLLDEPKEWAALRATSSEGGRQMISRNHRLAVGAQGIVGFVTSLGQARISQDTGDDRVHEPAAELPDTRSEMALPLISRNEVIGAIDIQDTKPEAFTEDDIVVLQTMADQIALAIENIILYTQTQETLEEMQRLFGDYSQQAWQNVHQKNLLNSYRYFSGAISEVKPDEITEMTENTVSIPVMVRGVNLGAIEISKGEENESWSDDELKLLNALSEQLGIALDSARLFSESQLRATTEQAISAINSQLWETMDINAILRTTAENLRETLALPELTIRMASPEDEAEASSNGNLDIEEIELND